MLSTPAAVINNQLPTNFYLPGFTNYYAYLYLFKVCLNNGEDDCLKNVLILFLISILFFCYIEILLILAYNLSAFIKITLLIFN